MFKYLLFVAVCYGLLVLAVYLMQERMLYLPNTPGRALIQNPADVGLAYEDVHITTSDGIALHGWFVPGPSTRTLLFFHGNAGNISHRLESLQQFHSLGLSVLIIDYRGYGQSGGTVSEQGLYRDARAAWRYLTEQRGIHPNNIIVFGRSLGGSVAAWLAARREALALIVESSFTSVPDAAQALYPWLPVRWLSRLQHATADYIRAVHSPLLVVHSRGDEIIPFHHGQAIFEAANEPRSFLELRGGHNDGFIVSEQVYLAGLRRFLTSLPVSSPQS